MSAPRVLLVDLNNFARYPSVAIGYLSAILKKGGYAVEVFAPLSTGLTVLPGSPKRPGGGVRILSFVSAQGSRAIPLFVK